MTYWSTINMLDVVTLSRLLSNVSWAKEIVNATRRVCFAFFLGYIICVYWHQSLFLCLKHIVADFISPVLSFLVTWFGAKLTLLGIGCIFWQYVWLLFDALRYTTRSAIHSRLSAKIISKFSRMSCYEVHVSAYKTHVTCTAGDCALLVITLCIVV